MVHIDLWDANMDMQGHSRSGKSNHSSNSSRQGCSWRGGWAAVQGKATLRETVKQLSKARPLSERQLSNFSRQPSHLTRPLSIRQLSGFPRQILAKRWGLHYQKALTVGHVDSRYWWGQKRDPHSWKTISRLTHGFEMLTRIGVGSTFSESPSKANMWIQNANEDKSGIHILKKPLWGWHLDPRCT